MGGFSSFHREPAQATCAVCGRAGTDVSRALGVCRGCIAAGGEAVGAALASARIDSRDGYPMPAVPPRSAGGLECRLCANLCRLGPGDYGFCGLRVNRGGKLHSLAGTARRGLFSAYHDGLPTNCVADWVCPGCSKSGYPRFSYAPGAEAGYENLAVFLAACSFDCAFCQNWTFRENTMELSPLGTPGELAGMVTDTTSCVCFFGGDPSPQMPFALAAAARALDAASGRILRICWETNGSVHPGLLRRAVVLSLETGGCVKFDLKAFDRRLHRALTGVGNERTLENLALAVELTRGRPSPPPVIASTLMVPGYVEAGEVRLISRFLASLNPDMPYALLGFHPDFRMGDMGTTTRACARACAAAAEEEGLHRVKVGNVHLLS